MTTATAIVLGLAAIWAVINWSAVARGDTRSEHLAKPLTMLALVAVALLLEPVDPTRRAWFVAAGVLSLAGDVFLMLPRDRFVPGLVAFLLAHLCYLVGLLQGSGQAGGLVVGLVVAVVMTATVGARVLRHVRRDHGALLAPVIVYLVVISAMVVTAFAVGPAPAAAGALLFYASDGILAWRRFVQPLRWGAVAVMVTYHLGQALLMLSLAQ